MSETLDVSKAAFLLDEFTAGLRFNKKGSTLNLAHTSSSSLNVSLYYSATNLNYVGAALKFEAIEDLSASMPALKESIKSESVALLAKTGLGYPKNDATARTTLSTNVSGIDGVTDYGQLQRYALIYIPDFVQCTDIVLPEVGKAYNVIFRPRNAESGTYRHLNFTGTAVSTTEMASKDAEIPKSGAFVLGTELVEETTYYTLVPAYGSVHGKYLTYNSAVSDNYSSAGVNRFTIDALSASTSGQIEASIRGTSELMGQLYFTYQRRSSSAEKPGCVLISETYGQFSSSTVPFLNGEYTSALILKEVENYPSTVQLKDAAGIEGIDRIATFSAPYASVVPEGVTAHYVSGENSGAVVITPIESGKAIPAGTGVLLTAENGTTEALMVPATTETQATIIGNLLGNSAGASKSLTAGSDYVLAEKNEKVAFYGVLSTDNTLSMNKAYLNMTGSAASNFRLSFDLGNSTTGIQSVGTETNAKGVLYDLQGRQVDSARKGVYICNGKKFLVK